ncbi:MAG: tRNA pseudouridine(38-40) synthase TruA [Gammaproteobacteria bacterium]
MRIALGLEYDGSAFKGWQTQRAGVRAIQPEVEAALSRVADHPVSVQCAGRTDTGVHATFQVVHFDTSAVRTPRAWVLGCNVNLPPQIAVLWARVVPDDFNARFSARARSYDYVLSNRQTRPALWRGRVSWECRPLDVAAMIAAAPQLLGEHDFSSFRAQGCQAQHPIRTVHRLEVRVVPPCIVVRVEANAFLQHMVRNFVGTLLEVGLGRHPPAWVGEVLAARDRRLAGWTAPPDGLYLTGVRYEPHFGLPAPPDTWPVLAAYAGQAFD